LKIGPQSICKASAVYYVEQDIYAIQQMIYWTAYNLSILCEKLEL